MEVQHKGLANSFCALLGKHTVILLILVGNDVWMTHNVEVHQRMRLEELRHMLHTFVGSGVQVVEA